MDFLHFTGARFVQWIQQFKSLETLFVSTSHLGSPLMAYILVFPLAYYVNPQLGLLTILCTSFSEWISGILKWLLHGHRPYWWVWLHAQQTGNAVIPIEQFSITCETGPGSPSGHCMITLAGMVPLVLYLHRCLPSFYQPMLYVVFGCFVVLLGLSRLYLAAHFPHQVIAGVISGLALGYMFTQVSQILRLTDGSNKANLGRTSLLWLVYCMRHPITLIWMGIGSFFLAWLFSWCLQNIGGLDINWSIDLAKAACRRPDWVHLSTSLMVGFARIAGYMCGLAVAFTFNAPSDRSLLRTNLGLHLILLAFVAHFTTRLVESICRRSVYSLLAHLLPVTDGSGPGVTILISSIMEGSLGPIVSVLVVPKLLSLFTSQFK